MVIALAGLAVLTEQRAAVASCGHDQELQHEPAQHEPDQDTAMNTIGRL